MSTLAFSRPWLFNVGNLARLYAGGGNIPAQTTFFAIKEVLLGGAGQYGWTDQSGIAVAAPSFWAVDSSCDSVNVGVPGDGVDWWTDYTKLIWSNLAGANSWIVLKNTVAIAPATLYWLIALENTANDARQGEMYVSKLGFGAVHGGTDGTTTARPTALDEQPMLDNSYWGSNNWAGRFHVMMSSDGMATRVLTGYETQFMGLWLLETINDAVDNLDYNLVASVWGAVGGNPVNVAGLSQTGQYLARTTGGTNVIGVLSGEGTRYAGNVNAGLSLADRVTWNDVAGTTQLMGVGVWGNTNPTRGHMGSLVDCWWGSDFFPCGRTYPNDYSRQLCTMGPLIVPWNGTVPKVF